jgi:hypothetical protein
VEVRYPAWICFATLAFAQGTDPKPKAEDYEVHAKLKQLEIGAEYMVYSFSGHGQTFLATDHLVVEVALFPPKGETVMASAAGFSLRVDGKVLRPSTPQMVAAAMQRTEWRQPHGVQATAGMGNADVILGGPPRQTPPYGGTTRTPAPPRAPEPGNRSGLPPPEKVRADELVVEVALPQGEFSRPVSGFVYFPFQGKASKIRSVELIYEDTTLKLK